MMADEKGAAKAQRQRPRPRVRASWFHFGILAFVVVYFFALLYWFGFLFLTGGTEEHVVMGIVIPVVVLIGCTSLYVFGTIVIEGHKADSSVAEEQPDGEAKES